MVGDLDNFLDILEKKEEVVSRNYMWFIGYLLNHFLDKYLLS